MLRSGYVCAHYFEWKCYGFRVPRYGNPLRVPSSQVRGPAPGSGFVGTGTRSGFRIPRYGNPLRSVSFGFPYLEMRNAMRVPVPGNPEAGTGSRTWESRSRYGFPYLGIQNPVRVPVPGILELGVDSCTWKPRTQNVAWGFSFLIESCRYCWEYLEPKNLFFVQLQLIWVWWYFSVFSQV